MNTPTPTTPAPATTPPKKKRWSRRRLLAVLVLFLLIVVAIVAVPFVFTRQVVLLYAAHRYPQLKATLANARLSPSGHLELDDLAVADPVAPAGPAVLRARRVDLTFAWRELTHGHLTSLNAQGLEIAVRSTADAPLTLLRLADQLKQPTTTTPSAPASTSPATPAGVDQIDVTGEVIIDAPAPAGVAAGHYPLTVHYTSTPTNGRTLQTSIGTPAQGTWFTLSAQINPGGDVHVQQLQGGRFTLRLPAAWINRLAPTLAPLKLAGDVSLAAETIDAAGDFPHPSTDPLNATAAITHGQITGADTTHHPVALQDFTLQIAFHGPRNAALWQQAQLPPGTFTAADVQAAGLHATNLQTHWSKTNETLTADATAQTLHADLAALQPGAAGTAESHSLHATLNGKLAPGPKSTTFLGTLTASSADGTLDTGSLKINLEALTAAGKLNTPLADPRADATLTAGRLDVKKIAVNKVNFLNLGANAQYAQGLLDLNQIAASLYDAALIGHVQWHAPTASMPLCHIQVEHLDMHQLLANFSPDHVDLVGRMSGSIDLKKNPGKLLAGTAALTADSPGQLKIQGAKAVSDQLTHGQDPAIAQAIMEELKDYAFKTGSVVLSARGKEPELTLTFTHADYAPDATRPVYELPVGGMKVKTHVNLNIPGLQIVLSHQSLESIISLAAGLKSSIGQPHP